MNKLEKQNKTTVDLESGKEYIILPKKEYNSLLSDSREEITKEATKMVTRFMEWCNIQDGDMPAYWEDYLKSEKDDTPEYPILTPEEMAEVRREINTPSSELKKEFEEKFDLTTFSWLNPDYTKDTRGIKFARKNRENVWDFFSSKLSLLLDELAWNVKVEQCERHETKEQGKRRHDDTLELLKNLIKSEKTEKEGL